MTRVGIVTQARMTSTRLPGKVLRPAGGVPLLVRHLDRVAQVGVPVVVATTGNSADDRIAAAAADHGAAVFRGDEHDVLSRFAGAAAAEDLDVVVRVTSDCPLIDPALIRRGIDRFLELADPYVHVSNVIERTYPRGFDFEVFSAEALREADARATEPADREHVTPYLYSGRSPRMRLEPILRTEDASRHRVTVDTEDDLRLVVALIEDFGAGDEDAEGIIRLLDSHPELAGINAHVPQKSLGE